MELVDTLIPPLFEKSGQQMLRTEAVKAGHWLGAFNLWIYQTEPEPAIIYQRRSPQSTWEPNKLDVSAGGHYSAGESLLDGLREAKEELGKDYNPEQVVALGRRLNVSPDKYGLERKTVLDIFVVEDNSPLTEYQLEEAEVSGLTVCSLAELLALHRGMIDQFDVEMMNGQGNFEPYTVTKDSFPQNWDDYHYKMAVVLKRYLDGEREVIY